MRQTSSPVMVAVCAVLLALGSGCGARGERGDSGTAPEPSPSAAADQAGPAATTPASGTDDGESEAKKGGGEAVVRTAESPPPVEPAGEAGPTSTGKADAPRLQTGWIEAVIADPGDTFAIGGMILGAPDSQEGPTTMTVGEGQKLVLMDGCRLAVELSDGSTVEVTPPEGSDEFTGRQIVELQASDDGSWVLVE